MISRGPFQTQQSSGSVTYTLTFTTYKIIFLTIFDIYSTMNLGASATAAAPEELSIQVDKT